MNTELLLTGAVIGGVTAILYSLKNWGKLLLDKAKAYFIFNAIVYDYDELFYVIEKYINDNHSSKVKSLEASYQFEKGGRNRILPEEYDSNSKVKTLNWKSEPNVFVIKFNGKKIIVNKGKKEVQAAQDFQQLRSFNYSLSAWRGKAIIKDFLNHITKEYNKTLVSDKITIYSSNYETWRNCGEKNVKQLPNVVLEKSTKELIIRDLDNFKISKQWYLDTNIAYKRGLLLYGPGGTGKTTLAQAIAAYMNRDICVLNLASVSSDSLLISNFVNLPRNTVLILEDIDCVFNQREAVGKTAITFSCLLNCLDGVVAQDGLITIITTNHIEKLDPALIRTGRCDLKIEIPFASTEEIEEYLEIFYNKKFMIGEELSLGMSSVQECCISNKENPNDAIRNIIKLGTINQLQKV